MSKRKHPLFGCPAYKCSKIDGLNDTHSVMTIIDRTEASANMLTGDIFRSANGKNYVVLGSMRENNIPSICTIRLDPRKNLEVFSVDVLKTQKEFVIPVPHLIEPIILKPTTYPDLFLVRTGDDGVTVKKPCHRAMIAEHSAKLADKIREMKPGGEITMPADESSEQAIDEFISVVYGEKRVPDTNILTTRLLFEWGCFRILDKIDDLVIDSDTLVSPTEALASGKYGDLHKLKEAIMEYLKTM
jgi:hypothetical protein